MTTAVPLDLAIITGLSGAGRSTAAKCLEDLGWFVVDNLPPALLSTMAELGLRSGGAVSRIAVVVDVRGRAFFADLRDNLDALSKLGMHPRVLFLEAGDDVLIRRFDHVRRPHPLQADGRVVDGINRERALLSELRGEADIVLDTTDLNVHELRAKIDAAFGEPGGDRLTATVVSFGYKYGLPLDADVVADCRFLPNPHWVEHLRPFTGQDPEVRDYVLGQPAATEFLDQYSALLKIVGEGYVREGKRYLTLAVGCTGGKHRSVAMAEQIAGRLAGDGVGVRVVHRDLGRGCDPAGPSPDGMSSDAVSFNGGGHRGPAVVAFGGGHGLAASLAALRVITDQLTAVVTVGDDGGSSGRLRAELDALPMGDLRMALAALAGRDHTSATWTDLFQYRFPGDGPLGGHAVGNLVLTALAGQHGSPVAALDLAGALLGAVGRVLPLSTQGIDIVAEVAGLDAAEPNAITEVRGQAAVATTPGRVVSLRLEPATPPVCEQAVAAVADAEWIVLGPGSLYTSMMPHLLVPEMCKLVTRSGAGRVLVLNLAAQPGETEGYPPEAHLDVLGLHVPDLTVDVVVADPSTVPDVDLLARATADLGGRLHLAPVGVPGRPLHDPTRLAVAFKEIFTGSSGPPSDGRRSVRPGFQKSRE